MAPPTPQELIDAIDTAMAANPEGVVEIEVNGRKVKKLSPLALEKLREKLAARQDRANGSMFAGVRFGRPS